MIMVIILVCQIYCCFRQASDCEVALVPQA